MRVHNGKKAKRPTYTLYLSAPELEALQWIGNRYSWSDALLMLTSEEEDGTIMACGTESDWWEVREAVEMDTIGGHSPYPCASDALATKVEDFLSQFC